MLSMSAGFIPHASDVTDVMVEEIAHSSHQFSLNESDLLRGAAEYAQTCIVERGVSISS
jgi:hypothetical protein